VKSPFLHMILGTVTAALLSANSLHAEETNINVSFLKNLPEKALEERELYSKPNEYFLKKLDDPQTVIDGQTLHPKLQYEFQERRKQRKAKNIDYNKWLFDTFNKPEGREWLLKAAEQNWVKMAEDVGPMAKVEDIMIDAPYEKIRVRVYWPEDPETQTSPKPGLLYFHGGGYIMSTSESVEPQSKILAKEGDMVVISVNYHLAPDHKFPASHYDAFAAYDWVVANAEKLGINPDQIGLAGDSAGGNLSAVISDTQAKTQGHMPKAQLLYYPFTDADYTTYRSYELFGNGYGLDKNFMKTATDMFLTDASDKTHPWLTLTKSVAFDKQPATIVATAGFDPIRDQGKLFADKLAEAGVDVTYQHYPSLNHGFLEASHVIDDAKKACFETARSMGELLRK